MWSSFALITLRVASARAAVPMVPTVLQAASALYVTYAGGRRFMSEQPFAVDAPDGNHDLQDMEESSAWAKRTIDVASVTEDADAITEMHDAVLGKKVYAVDGPDGEHDLEDVEEHLVGVNRIIAQASVLENPEDVKNAQHRRDEIHQKSNSPDAEFYNSKY